MWRPFDPERDTAAVERLHHAMEARIGRKMDLPDLSTEPIINAVVYEEGGAILHCMFIEAEIEACILSEKPLSSKRAKQAIDKFLMPAAQRYSLRIVRAYVPANILLKKNGKEGAVPRLLRKLGFTRENETIAQFYRWLVPQEERGGEL